MKILISISLLFALNVFADDFTTLDGQSYRAVKVTKIETQDIVVETDSGVERIKFSNLPKETQLKYGYNQPALGKAPEQQIVRRGGDESPSNINGPISKTIVGSQVNTAESSQLLYIVLLSVLLMIVFVVVLGIKNKVVIYYKSSDLFLTYCIYILAAALLFSTKSAPWIIWALFVGLVIAFVISILKSYEGNRSVVKAIVVFPTKFLFAGIITVLFLICGLLAIGGARAALDNKTGSCLD